MRRAKFVFIFLLTVAIVSAYGASAADNRIRTAKIAVVGDLMAHHWQVDDAYDKNTNTYDFTKSLSKVKSYLENADLTIGNLETTLAGSEAGYSDYPIFNVPDAFAKALKDAGFDLLTTANNHCNDKREAGLMRTLDVLDEIGLEHTGTFRTALEQDVIKIKNINGISFAILSYTYGTNGIPPVAGHGYTVNLLDKDLIYDDIRRAKAQNPDFIIVMPHMGAEYAQKPGQEQRDLVRFMWEAGADIVLAGHPHVLQPMEFETIRDGDGTERICFVDYSLGNFISSQRTLPRDAGCIVNLYFEKTKTEKAYLTYVSFIPTWVQFMNANGVYDIKTLPVFDALCAPDEIFSDDDPGIRPKDIARLINVQAEVTKIYLGKSVPLESMRSEYFVPTPIKRSVAPQGGSAQ